MNILLVNFIKLKVECIKDIKLFNYKYNLTYSMELYNSKFGLLLLYPKDIQLKVGS